MVLHKKCYLVSVAYIGRVEGVKNVNWKQFCSTDLNTGSGTPPPYPHTPTTLYKKGPLINNKNTNMTDMGITNYYILVSIDQWFQ